MANYYYYNETTVTSWILQYNAIEDKSTKEAKALAQLIMTEVKKIVLAVIFRHKFQRFKVPIDELIQEGFEACFRAISKYNPDYITKKGKKTTSFNYFSLVAKRHLMFLTMRVNKRKKILAELPIHDSYYSDRLESPLKSDAPLLDVIDSIKIVFTKYFNTSKKLRLFLPLLDFYCDYLRKYKIYNHRDFHREVKENAIKIGLTNKWGSELLTEDKKDNIQRVTRSFINIIKKNEYRLYK